MWLARRPLINMASISHKRSIPPHSVSWSYFLHLFTNALRSLSSLTEWVQPWGCGGEAVLSRPCSRKQARGIYEDERIVREDLAFTLCTGHGSTSAQSVLKCAEMVLYPLQNAFTSTKRLHSAELAVPTGSHYSRAYAFVFMVPCPTCKFLFCSWSTSSVKASLELNIYRINHTFVGTSGARCIYLPYSWAVFDGY